jgi:hypothetical protein
VCTSSVNIKCVYIKAMATQSDTDLLHLFQAGTRGVGCNARVDGTCKYMCGTDELAMPVAGHQGPSAERLVQPGLVAEEEGDFENIDGKDELFDLLSDLKDVIPRGPLSFLIKAFLSGRPLQQHEFLAHQRRLGAAAASTELPTGTKLSAGGGQHGRERDGDEEWGENSTAREQEHAGRHR